MNRSPRFLNAALVGAFLIPVLAAQPGESESSRGYGRTHFQITGEKSTQQQFDQGIALLHSFWYDKADKAFSQLAENDPLCGMAAWGRAMSLYHPLWERPDDATLRKGRAYVEQAKTAGVKTPRERDYIAAIETFYAGEAVPHEQRAAAYAHAMRQLYQRYPKDREAAIFYALSLLGSASPLDKTYANQKQAARILEKVSLRIPNHPGVIHYIIHAYDSPPLAHLGLFAARKYAKIAPAIPHAQHMPSHIFCRLGLWHEAADSNLAALEAARKSGDERSGELHSFHFLAYAYLQSAQDLKARQILDELEIHRKPAAGSTNEQTSAYFNATAALIALERRDWKEAAILPVRKAVVGPAHFARALGAAQTGDLDAARSECEKLRELKESAANSDDPLKKLAPEILWKKASAWLAHKENKDEVALQLLSSAVELDEAYFQEIPLYPARELLGELLLELNEPKRALAEFETLLHSRPNRFHALHGAATAAQRSGATAKAKAYFRKLLEVCSQAEGSRPELRAAQDYLAQNR
jgi:hypothetical protein